MLKKGFLGGIIPNVLLPKGRCSVARWLAMVLVMLSAMTATVHAATANDWTALQAAITNAPVGEPTTITITGHIEPPAGTHALNGTDKNITLLRGASRTGDLITVPSDVTLTLTNITIDGNKETVPDANGALINVLGTLNINTGAVLQNNARTSGEGGGVRVGGFSGARTVTMSSGAIIRNNSAAIGGGVRVLNGSTFTMSGGLITENGATGNNGGGGVSNEGTFTMTNGSITKNSAPRGGGVDHSSGGTFTMTGGIIGGSGNANTTTGNGGGVRISATVPFILGGTAVITHNTGTDDRSCNVDLNSRALTISTETLPAASMSIGVRSNALVTNYHAFVISGADATIAGYFTPDDAGRPFHLLGEALVFEANVGARAIAITAPETGETAQSTITPTDPSQWLPAGYTGSITWHNVTTNSAHTGEFAASTIYRADVTLTSVIPFQFPASPPTITVTGQTVDNRQVQGTGIGNTMTFSVTFAATASDDNEDIAAAKELIEETIFAVSQANAATAAAAKSAVEAIIGALELDGVIAVVVAGDFTAAVAGTAENINGTNGSFKFTITLNKGAGTEQITEELTLTITATAYQPVSISNTKKSDNRYGIRFTNSIVSEKAEISVVLPNASTASTGSATEVSVVIYDMTGNVVFERRGDYQSPANNAIIWDLRNNTGRFVANGTYLVVAEVKGRDGRMYQYSARLGVRR